MDFLSIFSRYFKFFCCIVFAEILGKVKKKKLSFFLIFKFSKDWKQSFQSFEFRQSRKDLMQSFEKENLICWQSQRAKDCFVNSVDKPIALQGFKGLKAKLVSLASPTNQVFKASLWFISKLDPKAKLSNQSFALNSFARIVLSTSLTKQFLCFCTKSWKLRFQDLFWN